MLGLRLGRDTATREIFTNREIPTRLPGSPYGPKLSQPVGSVLPKER